LSRTYQSEIGVIRTLVLKHARFAFGSDEQIANQWRELNYKARPDFNKAVDEYERFVELLKGFDIDIHFLPEDPSSNLDSIYVRDSSVSCNLGMILCSMGKTARRGEPSAMETAYKTWGIPIHGAIEGEGRLEGGDVLWLDDHTLIVGLGYRSNVEGIAQLKTLLKDCATEIIVAPLPHWKGQDDVFHLMSLMSPLDYDLMLVYSKLMPVPLRQALLARETQLIEVPDSEFETLGCNVLAIAPRKCLMPSGNSKTRALLEQHGVEIIEFSGEEICHKGAGGPTCLTRPILRASQDKF
jgi:N-dimethylarginine dimethylaminohydrolase